MDGKDVVAMARTGSEKIAAFLVPLFESLKAHSAKVECPLLDIMLASHLRLVLDI